MAKATLPRLVKNLPSSKYHAHKAISKHGLDDVRYAASLFRYNRDNPQHQTPAMHFGELYHLVTLEPKKFARNTVIEPEGEDVPKRPTLRQINAVKPSQASLDAIAYWEEFDKKAGGKMLVTAKEYNTLTAMSKALYAHKGCRRMLEEVEYKEPSLFWIDPVTGVEVRARLDLIRKGRIIGDLKTCESAQPEDFARHVFNFRYHVQAALYVDGYKLVTGEDAAAFVFLAQEKSAPYLCTVYTASPLMIELGREEYRKDLNYYAQCLATNTWPGLPDSSLLELPAWATKNLLS